MITTILTLFIIAVLGYVAFVTVHGYLAASGTVWQRLVAAFRASLTVFWARLNALSILAVAAVSEIASFLGAPGVKEAIEPYLAPQYMLAYVVLVLLGAEVARRRTLAPAPEAPARQRAPALQTPPAPSHEAE
jgi:hypothetical protein